MPGGTLIVALDVLVLKVTVVVMVVSTGATIGAADSAFAETTMAMLAVAVSPLLCWTV